MVTLKRKAMALVCACLFLFTLSGCRAATPKVVYTVYPIGYILERLGGDRLDIVSIQSDEIIQRATINPEYSTVVEDASLFLHIGNLEPYLEIYGSELRAAVPTIDLSIQSSIYNFQRYTRVVVDDVESWIETDYYRDEVMETIDTNERDLYIWTDPIAMVSMAREIKEWMKSVFIEDQDAIEEDFLMLESELIRLDADYQSLANQLKEENQNIKFVSMSASFGNWQRTYGIQVYPVILSKYGALPTDDQLEVIKQRIVADGVQYIAFEPNMSADMLELFLQLESELGLTRVTLSNMSSLNATEQGEDKDYISIMYDNLSTLENMIAYNEIIVPEDTQTHEGPVEENEDTE